MLRSRVSALVVFDADHALSGILSEGDLLRRSELGSEHKRPCWLDFSRQRPARGAYAHEHGRKVGEVMTRDVETIDRRRGAQRGGGPDDPSPHQAAAGAAGRNARRRRLALRSAQGASGRDAASTKGRAFRRRRSRPRSRRSSTSSTGRRARACASRSRTASSPSTARSPTNGCATALKVIAENTPGCVAVHDHMAWIEPNSGVVIPSEGDDPKA